jgi:hypothetical protein
LIARAAALAAVLCCLPRIAYGEGRINFRIDFNHTNIEGAHNNVGVGWQGVEIEFEKEFSPDKVVLSGFSFGLRRELFYGFTGFGTSSNVHRWDEGTYLMLRLYKTFDFSTERAWSIGPSFAILYGIPGTTLDRTVGANVADGASDYTHVFPIRNSDLPKIVANKAALVEDSSGLLYPEASMLIRRRLAKGGIVLDWIVGVRVIRFGIVDSNADGDVFSDRRMFIPSVGMRVGFRIF